MNRWLKAACAFVAVLAVTGGVTVTLDGGGFVAQGRTWADGPAASSASSAGH